MTDLIVYGGAGAFALLFSFFAHHAYVTQKLLSRMYAEERAIAKVLGKEIP